MQYPLDALVGYLYLLLGPLHRNRIALFTWVLERGEVGEGEIHIRSNPNPNPNSNPNPSPPCIIFLGPLITELICLVAEIFGMSGIY